MEGIDEDDTFEGFVIAHAPTLLGVSLVVTVEEPAARDAADEAWPIVYRHWPRIAHSPHRLSFALAPLVAAAVRRAPRAPAEGSGVRGLQLREDGLVPAGTVPATQTSEDLVGEALLDLGPRRRAVLALRWYAGLGGLDLVRAVRLRPLRAERAARQALGEVVLTAGLSAGTEVTGGGPDPTSAHAELVRQELAARASAVPVDGRVELDRLRGRLHGVRQLRPRRLETRWARAAAACALVATGLGTTMVMGSSNVEDPTGPRFAAPVAPPGGRLVGYRSVYAVVPSSWSHNEVECGRAVAETVIYPDVRSGCDLGRTPAGDVPVSTVTFGEPPTSPIPLGRLHEIDDVGGEGVFATRPVRKAQVLQQVVVIPQAQVMMTVRSIDRRVIDDIVGSLHAVPTGYAVVPPCEGRPLREAVGLLADAGLRVRLTQASNLSERVPAPPVTHQTLPSGRIVPTGTVVGLGFPSTN